MQAPVAGEPWGEDGVGTPPSQGTRECLDVRRVWPASPFPRGLGLESRQRGAPQRQVFGLVGEAWLTRGRLMSQPVERFALLVAVAATVGRARTVVSNRRNTSSSRPTSA